jgi:diguanylate cyclase (GGDEF)-like protein/PAS domain S-box-containing protein
VLLVGLLGLAFVAAGASYWRSRNVSQAQAQFRTTSAQLSGELTRALDQYGELLSGSAALFEQGVVNGSQYDAYLRAVGFGSPHFAGLQGVGLVRRVAPGQIAGYLESLRKEGLPATAEVVPPGPHAQYCFGTYADWSNFHSAINLYGYDLCAVPSISAILTRASSNGQQQVLPGSALGSRYASDFVLVQRVYRGSATSAQERGPGVIGWALGIINGPDLMRSIPREPGAQLLVLSGSTEARGPVPIMWWPLAAKVTGTWGSSVKSGAYSTWYVRVRATPGSAQSVGGQAGPIVLLAVGLLAVGLLVALLASLMSSRSRAVRAVEQAARSLRSSEERFGRLVRNSSDLICVLNDKAEVLYASPAAERVLGFLAAENMGRSVFELVHPDDRDEATSAFLEGLLQPGVHEPLVMRLQTKSGEWRVLEVVATNCLADPAVAGVVMNARDITERANLTRALNTLAKSNQVLVNAADEASLLSGICETIIEAGSYRLAWVGYAQRDDAQTVRPMAWAGPSGYADRIRVTWTDDENGRGPVGAAIRSRCVQVIDDVTSSSAFAPWRATAVGFGLRSCCALPLEANGEVTGALTIYAAEPAAFGRSEVTLLSELASALAYGIGRLRDGASLQASEERFRTLAAAAPIGILEFSASGGVNYANPRAAEITGRDIEALMGWGWREVVHPEDAPALLARDDAKRRQAGPETRFRIQRPGGEVRHVRVLRAPKGQGRDSGDVVTVEDITEEVQANEALIYQAFYDTLTGLPNRALFLDRLDQELARHRRGGPGIAVLFLDLDRFKFVNDGLGHETGDAVLKEVGGRFIHAVRAGETAARFSGDEFVFIIRDVRGDQDAVAAAKRLQAALEEPVRCEGQELIVTGSVGIVIPDGQADAPTVLRDADAAMYQAKEDGRNRHAIFDEAMHRRSVDRLAMEGELRQAIAGNELEVYYQPVVEPTSGRPVGAEALVRWNHPSRGLVLPLEFIPVAEDSGLIKPLGRWVFEQAVSQLASWDAGKDGPRLEYLAINLSAHQLDDPETPDIVRDVLNRYGMTPGRVCVEVTESVVMRDSAPTRRSLAAFRNLGLRVAIDDFGTGYSSLAYLHTLPVTTVKIDRSFIERLGGADDSAPVVKAVIEMTHAIGLSVVAEGVSSDCLWNIVATMGCDSAQGYVWSPPLPAVEFTQWWRQAQRIAHALPTSA